jgi:diguanylate cyclase (GGDEF)-like protein
MRLRFSRAATMVVALALFFTLLVASLTALLIHGNRNAALAASQGQAERFVSGAEVAINRSLLGVDVLLSSVDGMLSLSSMMADWIDVPLANRVLQTSMRQNMLVRQVALLDAAGRVIASSDPDGGQRQMQLPAGFVNEALALPVSTLVISAPMVNANTSETVLFLARHIKLADASRLLAVAEIPVTQLTAILVQGVDISGLEATMERASGQLLASVPTLDALSGKQLPTALGAFDAPAVGQAARLSGAAAIVVARKLLFHDTLISASIPLDSALHHWLRDSVFIAAVALAFVLLIVAAAASAIRHLNRLAAAQASLADAKETLDQALASMDSGLILLDAQLRVMAWNRRYLDLFPWLAPALAPQASFRQLLKLTAAQTMADLSDAQREVWIDQRLLLLSHPQESHHITLPDDRAIEITERPTPTGGVVIVYQDVTRLHRAAAEIKELAFNDALTGLPNRRLLADRLQQTMAFCVRNHRYGALLFVDLDRFKTLNDTLGHDMGDLLLRQVARRLKDCVRKVDTVARLGGDEFVVMLQDLGHCEREAHRQTQAVGNAILASLTQPYDLNGSPYHSTCSLGATLFSDARQTSVDLLKQADIAMYQVKAAGRNGLCFFNPQMLAAITERAALERDLRQALREGQFTLHFQIQVAQHSAAVGAEVLIRWQHPHRGPVSPLVFIGLAEETGLIVPIGQWVLQAACQQLKAWESQPALAHLVLAVNVSARQFQQDDLVAQVAAVLGQTGANPARLKLELTESLVLTNVQNTIEKMTALKRLGLSFSMDDFGTGHSSLSYLTQLPLDQLKIDQSFVRNIGLQATDSVIIDTIIGMARNLGLEVIAEGVETVAQRDFLLAHGCHLFQGYLYGKPVPIAQYEQALTA